MLWRIEVRRNNYLPNLSLCFVSKKAATFSIGFLRRKEGLEEDPINRGSI